LHTTNKQNRTKKKGPLRGAARRTLQKIKSKISPVEKS
jgi:hypothetical protein